MNLKVTVEEFLNNLKNAAKQSAETVKEEESDKKKALKSELDEIEQAYNNSPYMTINGKKVALLKPLEDDPASDEEIKATAESIYEEDKKNKEI